MRKPSLTVSIRLRIAAVKRAPRGGGRLDPGLLTRTDLRDLGLQRGAVDAVFRALDVIYLPGYRRPLIRVEDYLELIADCTFGDDVVHPVGNSADKHPRLRRPHG
jgi:hypothetical protein